jgi:hypothetical protein
MSVKDFVNSDMTFSIHDITVDIREKCNSGKLEIPEIEIKDFDPNLSYRFNVEHTAVRSLFNEMWDLGVFDGMIPILGRKHNGRYWEFSSVSGEDDYSLLQKILDEIADSDTDGIMNTPVQILKADPTPTPTALAADEKAREAKRRIKLYLENCAKIPVYPTLKQVQSAIHRPRGLPLNYTCDEINSFVTELGLSDKVSK